MKTNFFLENSKFLIIFYFGLLCLPLSSTIKAHTGRTAADGCHKDKKSGERHCHDNPPTQKPKKKFVEEKIIISSEAVLIDSCYDGDTCTTTSGEKLDLHP